MFHVEHGLDAGASEVKTNRADLRDYLCSTWNMNQMQSLLSRKPIVVIVDTSYVPRGTWTELQSNRPQVSLPTCSLYTMSL